MTKSVMTEKHRTLLEDIMKWYWEEGKDHITRQDYEFVYDLWNHGVNVYGSNIQKRMNTIRDKYIEFPIKK